MLATASASAQAPALDQGPRVVSVPSAFVLDGYTPSFQVPDSPFGRGVRAGETAARERSAGGRFVLALLGGFPIGLFGVPFVHQRDPVPVLWGTAGLALVYGAARGGAGTPPPDEPMLIAESDADYQRGFRIAYSDDLRGRRRRAGYGGGAVGAVLGLGVLAALLSD
jgi:hypothetical protein